jgi:CHAD domain-containing protein
MRSRLMLHARIRVAASRFERCEADLCQRCDTRSVHALRVAARRLRALLWSMKPWIRRDLYKDCLGHLKVVSRQLAPVRDLDVLREVVREQVAGKAGLSAGELRQLDADLGRQRKNARLALRRAIHAVQFRQHSRHLGELLADAALFRRSVPASVLPWERRILRGVDHLERRCRRAVRKELHRIRILAKRCRYSLEALGPRVPRKTRRRMRQLQTLLGNYCDMRLAVSWLQQSDSLHDRPRQARLLRAAQVLARQRAQVALRALHDGVGYSG